PLGGFGSLEIVKITGVTANTLTVVRGQEDTKPSAFLPGSTIELRVTAHSLARLRNGYINIQAEGAKGDGITNDQAAVNAAVALALLTGSILVWPAGTYIVPDSIPNFHDVYHKGDGKIQRGGDTYHITPR